MNDRTPETPAKHLRHAISDALRQLDLAAERVADKRFAGVARAILRGQLGDTAPLARLAGVERELEDAIDYRDAVAQDHLEEKARAEAAERERDHAWNCHKGQVETKRRLSERYGQLHARAEAAETALRDVEEALRAVQRNDMTRPYEYRGRGARRADGLTPTDGSRWLTPRELATIALAPRTTTTEEVPHA